MAQQSRQGGGGAPPDNLTATAAAARHWCAGCKAYLYADAFSSPKAAEGRKPCRACVKERNASHRRKHCFYFAAANLRKLARRRGDSECLISPADVEEVVLRFGGRCLITGSQRQELLGLVKIRPDEPLTLTNAAPVLRTLVKRIKGALPCDVARKLAAAVA